MAAGLRQLLTNRLTERRSRAYKQILHTVHCQAHNANAYTLLKSKFCFPDGGRASQIVHSKRRSNRCSVRSFWSEQCKAVYGRRPPNCCVNCTTKTAALLFLVEANLCIEASVKLLPHCTTIAAHQKQRAITSRSRQLVVSGPLLLPGPVLGFPRWDLCYPRLHPMQQDSVNSVNSVCSVNSVASVDSVNSVGSVDNSSSPARIPSQIYAISVQIRSADM